MVREGLRSAKQSLLGQREIGKAGGNRNSEMKAEASIIESGAAGDLNLQKKAGALQLCGWQEGRGLE